MEIILSGYKGFMGRETAAMIAQREGMHLAAGVDPMADGTEPVPCFRTFEECTVPADCVIDFSSHAAAPALIAWAVKRGLPMIIATTGHTDEEKQLIREASTRVPVFYTGNFSLGIAVLTKLARTAAAYFPDAEIEIVEAHHNRKADAPSGTALGIAEAISADKGGVPIVTGRSGYGKRDHREVGINSLRLGNVVGMHEILITTGNQTLTLKHEAHSRALFAEGALDAALFLADRPAGLYAMPDMVK